MNSSLVEGDVTEDNSHKENDRNNIGHSISAPEAQGFGKAIEHSISWLKEQTLCIVQSLSGELPRDHSLVEGDVDARNDKDDKQDEEDECLAWRLQKDPSVFSADWRLPRDPSILESNTGVNSSMLGSDASVVDSQNKGAGAQVSTGEVRGEPSVFSVGEGDRESANMEEVEEASSTECLRLVRDPSVPESNAGVVDYQNEGTGAQVTTGEMPGDPSVLSAGEGGPEYLNKEGEEDTLSDDSLRLPMDPSMPGGNASVDDS